jgi:sphingomyelin phosphodiesterase acid-like 3
MLVALAISCWAPSRAAAAQPEQLWLAVSDIHLNLFAASSRSSPYGFDTNRALFESALAQMKRAAPNPTLVLLPGDFLAHDFAKRVRPRALSPNDAALRSMQWIAEQFRETFPKAQFAIALGNNDVPCGDYESGDDSPYLEAVARIWAPLIDRRGAAPDFAGSFERGGAYTARLPVAGMRLVVLNTVLLSSQYRGNCGAGDSHAASNQMTWLSRTLGDTPARTRNVVFMHIPPGFDAFSTEYVHGLLAWPFLQPRYSARLAAALAAPRNRVAYAVAGHTHRFDFRLARGVPIVVLGALSPIYHNNPAFYVFRVSPNGALRDIDVHVFDDTGASWRNARSFDRDWGIPSVDGASLVRLHARLAEAALLRAKWQQQSEGWLQGGETDDVQEADWRISWCAQDLLERDFSRCAGIRKRVLILPILGALFVIAAVVFVFLTRLRAYGPRIAAGK